MNARPRIALFLLVTAALVAAAWWTGKLAIIVDADHIHALPIAGMYAALGMALGWRDRWHEVDWLADKAPILGLIGTVLGLLLVLPDIRSGADAHVVNAELVSALVANLLGISIYGYLELARHVCSR